MTTRAPLSALAVAGLAAAAHAQEIVYSWSWHEVIAGTSTPVAIPDNDVGVGEGARLVLTATINPGIGSPATYSPPPPPGSGTIAGLGSIFFDLIGTGANGGTWSFNRRNPLGVIWALGSPGTPEANGNITAAGAGQFVLPGAVANSTNPVVGIWAMTWTPDSYEFRAVNFRSQAAVAGQGNHSSILIQYGEDPNTGDPLYVGRFVNGQFGDINFTVGIPTPSTLALITLAAIPATRRRR